MKKYLKIILSIVLLSTLSCSKEEISNNNENNEFKKNTKEIDTEEEAPDVEYGTEFKVKAIFYRDSNEGNVVIENFLQNTVNANEAEFSSATFQFKYNPTTDTYTFFSKTAKINNFHQTAYSSYLFKVDSKDVKHNKQDDSLFFQIYYSKHSTWYFDDRGNRLDTPGKQVMPFYYAISIYKEDFKIVN